VIPLPVVDVPGSADSLSFADKTTTFDDGGELPKTVELITSQERYFNSLSDERLFRNSRLLSAQRSPVFNLADGLVGFRYVVEAFTNYNGRLLPTRFRYFDYRSSNSNHNFSLVSEGVGMVTSMRKVGEPGNVFSTNTIQSVFDLRFRQHDKIIDAILYTWPKAEVPSVNDPALQQRLKDTLRKAAIERVQ
jgi:hypothetical protein